MVDAELYAKNVEEDEPLTEVVYDEMLMIVHVQDMTERDLGWVVVYLHAIECEEGVLERTVMTESCGEVLPFQSNRGR